MNDFARVRYGFGILLVLYGTAAADEPRTFTNSLGMKFVRVSAGDFLIGSPDDDPTADDDERPRRHVRITRDFYLGVYEVTQAEHERVMGENPSWFSATGGGRDLVRDEDVRRLPVENVSWDEANEFCRKLNDVARSPLGIYHLPTEAQWEYACRAGTTTRYHWGDEPDPKHANFHHDAVPRTHPIGSYEPNAWGLYDMHGNVWEWCTDHYSSETYRYPSFSRAAGKFGTAARDPLGTAEGTGRVVRGGDYRFDARHARSANRDFTRQTRRDLGNGFRVAILLFAFEKSTPDARR